MLLRSPWAWSIVGVLLLSSSIGEGADIRIKSANVDCECWTRRGDGIVTLERCEMGTESVFTNITETGALQSANGECLTRITTGTRTDVTGEPCEGTDSSNSFWELLNGNQLKLTVPGEQRGYCPQRREGQPNRIGLVRCRNPGGGPNRWDVVDASEDPCPGSATPSPPSSPSPSPPASPSPPDSTPSSPDPPPSPSQEVRADGDDDDGTVAAAVAGSISGTLLLSGTAVLAVYLFKKRTGKINRKSDKIVTDESGLNVVVVDKPPGGDASDQGSSGPAGAVAAGGVSSSPPSDPNVLHYEQAEAMAPLLAGSAASSAVSSSAGTPRGKAGGDGGPVAGVTIGMLDEFGKNKGRASADPHKLMESTSVDDDERLVAILTKKLSGMHEGSEFAGRYVIEDERFSGSSAVVFFAKGKFNRQRVAIKFFADDGGFEKEIEVRRKTSSQFIARLEDVVPSSASGGLPNALVFQRGDYTLADWLKKSRPKQLLVKLALSQILEGLQEMHTHYIIHRDLKPSNIMFFSDDHSWKLTDLDNWARAGEPSNVAYTLMYAPPESVVADIQGKKEVVLDTSADMWSFGIIAYELTTGTRFYGHSTSAAEVRQRLLGFGDMPALNAVKERQLRRLIANTLQRNPQARWSAATALGNAYFRSADDTLQQAEKFDKLSQQMARIEQLTAIAADEIRSANLMVNIVLEGLSKAEQEGRNLRSNFEFHPGNECPLTSDEGLPDHPIFMTALEQTYKMRISVTHERSLPLRIQSMECLHVTPVDGPALQLETFVTSSAVDEVCAVAVWDPARHGAASLLSVTPSGGPLDRRLVPVDVALAFTLQGQGSPSILRGKLFLKMHRAGEKFVTRKLFKRAGKMWDEAPMWVKDGAKGAMFCYNVATTVLGA
eukprot:evm.model.scf_2148.1 EVM.evm.TU.scf_2148.1   scf_2148:3044-10053(-)